MHRPPISGKGHHTHKIYNVSRMSVCSLNVEYLPPKPGQSSSIIIIYIVPNFLEEVWYMYMYMYVIHLQ